MSWFISMQNELLRLISTERNNRIHFHWNAEINIEFNAYFHWEKCCDLFIIKEKITSMSIEKNRDLFP